MGVCIGTMALVIVLSAFNGLSNLVSSLYNSFDPDIEITVKEGKTFSANTVDFQKVRGIEGIAYFSEIIEGNALLKFNEKQCVATIKGVENSFVDASNFDTLITEGVYSIENNNIVMGKGIGYLLQSAMANPFTPISIYSPKRGEVSKFDDQAGLNEMKAFSSGLFTINDEFDYKYVIANINKIRELFDYDDDEVTSVELSLKEGADIEKVEQDVRATLGGNYNVKNRFQQNALLYKTLKSEKLWTFIILVFILVIATFNVIGSLTMLIIEKKNDITVLNNLGASGQVIRRIFLAEGMLITLIGALLGIFLGVFVCWLQVQFSFVRFSEGYVVDAYPIDMQLMDFIYVFTVVLLIGFFAAWYPVRVFTKKHLSA